MTWAAPSATACGQSSCGGMLWGCAACHAVHTGCCGQPGALTAWAEGQGAAACFVGVGAAAYRCCSSAAGQAAWLPERCWVLDWLAPARSAIQPAGHRRLLLDISHWFRQSQAVLAAYLTRLATTLTSEAAHCAARQGCCRAVGSAARLLRQHSSSTTDLPGSCPTAQWA